MLFLGRVVDPDVGLDYSDIFVVLPRFHHCFTKMNLIFRELGASTQKQDRDTVADGAPILL